MSLAPSGPPKKRGCAGTVYGRGRKSAAFIFDSKKIKTSKTLNPDDITYKRRKITGCPLTINPFNEKAETYTRLVDLENTIDSHINQERRKIQQLFNAAPSALKGILRIHIYNTSSRPQSEEQSAVWSLRIQGRLIWPDLAELYSRNVLPAGYIPKFSSFFRLVQVFLPGNEKVEWLKQQLPRETDGIEIKRSGYGDSEIKIVLHIDHKPPHYKLSNELCAFLGTSEESKENILQALWEYISLYKLQDPEEKKFINNDASLFKIFGEERTDISFIQSKINKHLADCDPVVIIHKIKIGDWTETEHLYDILVDFEDTAQLEVTNYLMENNSIIFSENAFTNYIPALRARPGMEVPKNNSEVEIEELNRKLLELKKKLSISLKRKKFISEFLAHPREKVENLVKEQDSCIQVLQNLDKYDEINKDVSKDEMNAEFFRQPFVKDAIERYLDLNR
jgi:SWI/SNF-related matrix-associated actin-dependent regulator of chromatin subfamily D